MPTKNGKKRKHFRRRAAIEPVIGHLKSDHRAAMNFLKGQMGDSINFMMAAAGFNFKKLMVKLKEKVLWLYSYPKNMLDLNLSRNPMAFRYIKLVIISFFKGQLIKVVGVSKEYLEQ
ncbi:hypothetical protein C21_01593 [Arenibacter sp. NBRC 103722]|nr:MULTISPECIES: hypothetical protein [Arenibacter]GBF19428.1 hypothetical protein C21_01593 [Arenibacter sp. NBRC 103722]